MKIISKLLVIALLMFMVCPPVLAEKGATRILSFTNPLESGDVDLLVYAETQFGIPTEKFGPIFRGRIEKGKIVELTVNPGTYTIIIYDHEMKKWVNPLTVEIDQENINITYEIPGKIPKMPEPFGPKPVIKV